MSENKKTDQSTSKKTGIAVSEKKTPILTRRAKKPTAIRTAKQQDLWRAFDETFDRFRNDFENLLFPEPMDMVLYPLPETRVPAVDLENREKDFLLKAEMPGFKKEDIEINVQDNGIEITGTTGWKYSQKDKAYICKERACESFYRYVDLPEKVKIDEVNADLCDGVLEITLPKQEPKQKRKITVK